MTRRRWIHYEKEIQDRISQEGDITLNYTFVEFLLNTLATYDKILVIKSRNTTTKLPLKNIVDCGVKYDRFYCKLQNCPVNYVEFKYPEFGLENNKDDTNYKRFESGEGDKGILIYDNTGVDDYYFLNDPEELEKFINLINHIEDNWRNDYNYLMGEYKKQLKLNNEINIKLSELKKEVMNVINRKIKNTNSNPPSKLGEYSKVIKALKNLKDDLRDVVHDQKYKGD